MIKKAFLKGTLFLLIIALLIYALDPVFVNKVGGHRSKLVQGLYRSEKDAYDVVLIGSSHMNGAINPDYLWEEYGITSFNYATGGEPFDVSYYLLKEVLKKQRNPVVAVDIYYLGLIEPYGSEGYIRYVIDNMRFSINKIDAVIHCTPRKEWLYYLFPFFKYHDRWKELSQSDFDYNYNAGDYMKGFSAGTNIYGKENRSDLSTKETAELPDKSQKYLNKLIELSKSKGFQLIFINAPHDYVSMSGFPDWHKEPAKMYNKIAEIASKNNIPFIDYNKMLDDIDFDFKSDMNNDGHVNVWGSEKMTAYFGQFLTSNYKVEDHRNDADYSSWNDDLKLYYREIAAEKLFSSDNIDEYLGKLKDENYIIALSSSNNFNIGKDFKNSLKQLGIQIDKEKNNYNYISAINSGNKEFEKWGNSNLSGEAVIDNEANVKVTSLEDESGSTEIIFNGTDYSYKGNGMNIVVYDKLLNRVVDSIYIDDKNSILRRE